MKIKTGVPQKTSNSPISIIRRNLYPFTETTAKPNCTLAVAVEEVDIGGVTFLRAAAKDHKRGLRSDPKYYKTFLGAWKDKKGEVSQGLRVLKAFEVTATYDEAISRYFRKQYEPPLLSPTMTHVMRRLSPTFHIW